MSDPGAGGSPWHVWSSGGTFGAQVPGASPGKAPGCQGVPGPCPCAEGPVLLLLLPAEPGAGTALGGAGAEAPVGHRESPGPQACLSPPGREQSWGSTSPAQPRGVRKGNHPGSWHSLVPACPEPLCPQIHALAAAGRGQRGAEGPQGQGTVAVAHRPSWLLSVYLCYSVYLELHILESVCQFSPARHRFSSRFSIPSSFVGVQHTRPKRLKMNVLKENATFSHRTALNKRLCRTIGLWSKVGKGWKRPPRSSTPALE